MKQLFIYILVALASINCSKRNALDITPDGRLTLEDVFIDDQQTEAYLNTVYSSIPSYFFSYINYTFLAGISDECKDSDVGNLPVNVAALWNSGTLTPSNNPLDIAGYGYNPNHYVAFWTGIRDANVFLSKIDNANVPVATKRSRFKAEARLLRAFFYWELIKERGPMPIVEQPFDNTFDYSVLTRPSFQEVVDFIVADCNAAIENPDLPMRITIGSESDRFTKAVAYAVRSQALLYNASPLWNPTNDPNKWQSAATAAKEAISVLTANGYKLDANYGNYFLNALNVAAAETETIYEVPNTNHINHFALTLICNIPSKPGWRAGVCPTQELVDAYDMQATGEPAILGYQDEEHLQPIINTASGYDESDPYVGRDPRFYATVWYNGAQYDNVNGAIHTIQTFIGGTDQLIKNPPNANNTHTGYYLRKFIDPRLPPVANADAAWKKYRLAEIYLNLAEAENEANGPTTDAYNAVNTVRNRAQMPDLPPDLTQEQFRERVRNERRIELVIEEHRMWDVRRWKILDKTDKLVTGMEITRNPDNTFSYQRFVTERRNAWQEKYLILPIPLTDASIIPDFSANQNPGW